MKLVSFTFALIGSTLAVEKCPGPFEVGYTGLKAYFGKMQFTCSNYNRETRCLKRNGYSIPDKTARPGGCQKRNEPPVADALIWNYDCRSANNHWNFANEMVNKYNLTCDFVQKTNF